MFNDTHVVTVALVLILLSQKEQISHDRRASILSLHVDWLACVIEES